jgi:hypothetical protein
MLFMSVGPKTSEPVVTDSTQSFLAVFVFFGMTTFSACDSDDVRANFVPRLREDERDGAFIVLILLVGEDSSVNGLFRLPLSAMGVGAGVGGML